MVALLAIFAPGARADEGMWPLDRVPVDQIARAHGFRPDQAWIDKVRLSAVRLARGCSGAFVSAQGLIQTNHHCARACIEQLSTAANDLDANGFYAATLADERKCPAVEINQLVAITDVTLRITAATAGKSGAAFADALRAVQAQVVRACSANDAALRCDVVALYNGGVYSLYKYRRYQDVRLVFAPETAVAFFGGDPDNFDFPRFDLDVAFLRVWDGGAPLDTRATFLPYAKADVTPADLVFTAGHPGRTNRLDTVALLELQRDVSLPQGIFISSELRGILTEFSARGPEQARIANGLLFGVENGLKGAKGRLAALVEPGIIQRRAATERATLARLMARDRRLAISYTAALASVRATVQQVRVKGPRYDFIEGRNSPSSRLFDVARDLVRYAAEREKPDEQRLRPYTTANFPILRQALLSTAPVYPELERLRLTFSLTKLREGLGVDDPFVAKVLGRASPTGRAAELVDGTTLANLDVRAQLLEGGAVAIAASTDPMIVLARSIDAEQRAAYTDFEDTIDAPLIKAARVIANAQFKAYGTSRYPDATFTLRLSVGTVAGFPKNGRAVEPVTRMAGLYVRATDAPPFKLPARWLAARDKIDPQQALNFSTTNDIIGGNSGSPVINRGGEVVGLIFDGNLPSLGGGFGYDGTANRAIAVAIGAVRHALSHVYGADRIVVELAGQAAR